MNNYIPTIGLIGGIGSGKSTVAEAFRSLGCIVANADENAKKALLDEDIRDQLVSWWGKDILDEDGSVSHKALATIVFKDKSQRLRLESVLHPRAKQIQEEQFRLACDGTKALIIDAPLLLEAGLDEQCDAIVYVDASLEIRQNRVKKYRGWSIDEFNRREAAQLPLDTKRNKADYVVINEGELDEVHNQVKQILEDIHNRRPV
jgi:dephospho-CoA kinase